MLNNKNYIVGSGLLLVVILLMLTLFTLNSLSRKDLNLQSKADTQNYSIQMDSGNFQGSAQIVNDTNAIGGSYLLLGTSAASLTLTPTTPPTTTPPPIKPISWWENTFLGLWQSEYNIYNPKSLSGDSALIYDMAYGLDANYAMFRATGKTQYLDRDLLYIDNIISTARPSSSFPSSQYKDSYLTWISHSLWTIGLEYPLPESYGWRYVTALLYAMKQNPAVYNDDHYRTEYDKILAFTEKNIWEKWYKRSVNDNIYRSRTHMASHWALISMDLFFLSNDPVKKVQYKTVWDNIDHNGMSNNSNASLRSQMVVNPRNSGGYSWSDIWGNNGQPAQDMDHGNGVMTYITEAHDAGYNWTDADIQKFVVTLDKVIWISSTTFAGYVDGSGSSLGNFDDGFANLARYSVVLQQRLEKHTAGRTTQLYGNGALSAKMLGAPY